MALVRRSILLAGANSANMIGLGTLGGDFGEAPGINDDGFVAGDSLTTNQGPHAGLFDGTTIGLALRGP